MNASGPTLDLPADKVAFLAVSLGPVGTINVYQPLSRLEWSDFQAITSGRGPDSPLRATPVHWSRMPDNRVAIWPTPDRDYPVLARDHLGNDMTGKAKPASLPPTNELVSAFAKAQTEAQRPVPPRVERFGPAPAGEEE